MITLLFIILTVASLYAAYRTMEDKHRRRNGNNFNNIGQLQRYWQQYMEKNHDVKKIFVNNKQFNIELRYSRENGLVTFTTVHI